MPTGDQSRLIKLIDCGHFISVSIFSIVGEHRAEIVAESLKAEFHISLNWRVIFSYFGFKTGITRRFY